MYFKINKRKLRKKLWKKYKSFYYYN